MAPFRHPYLKFGGVFLAVVIVAGYFIFQARGVITGPLLFVETPVNGGTVNESLITVRGVAPAAAYVSLNDRPIFTNPEGGFHEELLLAKGYNILSIEARDRFGRETRQILEVIYQ